ncbi:alpha/beta fold hydrolase [Longispora albida]|uniref:alpha/beta fold hydrolase n=1 Tax=Longispora albida TaxID=203523 RepID=UPI0024810948|nr:alpha/beta hydrolase [Longispora albida]
MGDGAELWTTVEGPEGGAPVVLCHGGPGMWDYLGPVSGMLADRYRVYRFDQRGCGRSSGPGDYGLARAVADLDEVRAGLGVRRWAVFGHSWGATLALAYAWQYPDRVTRLVYCSGVGPGDAWREPFKAEFARRLTEDQRTRLAALQGLAVRSAAEEHEYRVLSWLPDYADPVRAPGWAAEEASAPYPINVAANVQLSADAATISVAEALARTAKLAMPALFVHGSEDPRPAWNVAQLAEALPGARFTVIPGAGHSPWLETPQDLAKVLRDFLQVTPHARVNAER